jgi:hypothetical protein
MLGLSLKTPSKLRFEGVLGQKHKKQRKTPFFSQFSQFSLIFSENVSSIFWSRRRPKNTSFVYDLFIVRARARTKIDVADDIDF